MSIVLALLAFSTLSGAGEDGASSSTSSAKVATAAAQPAAATSPAVQSAQRWLALVDAGDWLGSWKATGSAFRSLNSSKTWADVSEKVRAPLGAVVSRTLISEEEIPAPPYGYQLVKFRTSYANKADAIETLSLIREDGEWRVVGCIIE